MTKPTSTDQRRIAFVIEKLAARSGGAERVLIDVANAFNERGYAVEIISHEYRGARPFYSVNPGIILSNLRPPRRSRLGGIIYRGRELFHKLHRLPVVRNGIWLSRHGAFWRRLQAHLIATKPDAVVGFMPPAISAIALSTIPSDTRKIASTHNEPRQDFLNEARWDPSRLDQQRRLRLMGEMDKIGVLLPEYMDFYNADIQDKLVVLPNAVKPVNADVLARTSRTKTVLAVGRLASVKRHDLLFESWAKLRGEFPDWRLKIFGEGPLRSVLEKQVHDLGLSGSAAIMGHTTDVSREYLEGAILAHPAEFEGFPLVVTEALASGMPVVGFADCSGLNRLVEDGVNGVLVSAEGSRVDTFSDALGRLMRDRDAREALGRQAPGTMSQYAPDVVMDIWERMLFE